MESAKDDFYGQALAAIDTAEDSGQINRRRAARLRDRLNTPRHQERMRARSVLWLEEQKKRLPVTKEGTVDWESFFTRFFESWLPMVLKLFGL